MPPSQRSASETSLWERSRSLFNKEKAKELATSVAERVYRSDAVKAASKTITNGVARNVGGSILLAASDAAEPALECLKAFLGPPLWLDRRERRRRRRQA